MFSSNSSIARVNSFNEMSSEGEEDSGLVIVVEGLVNEDRSFH